MSCFRPTAHAHRACDARRVLFVLWKLRSLAFCLLAACGPVTYTLDVNEAERVVTRARAENASYFAPYDLYFAEAHLAKAHEEAAQGRYEDAIHAAGVALSHGRRALTRSAQPGPSER